MKRSKETLKEFFETGDKPTQQQYADLIDSFIDAQQPAGEGHRTFSINETGEVTVIKAEAGVVQTAKITITAEELLAQQVKTLIPAQGENTIIDILSVNTVFNFSGLSYGDGYLEFNHGIAAISLGDVNTYNYVVKTVQGSQETRSIPVNAPFTVTATGTMNSGNDGAVVYITYRIITTDGYQVATVL